MTSIDCIDNLLVRIRFILLVNTVEAAEGARDGVSPAGGWAAQLQRLVHPYPYKLLVRIHLIIELVWWTGLAPWEFQFPFPGRLISL